MVTNISEKTAVLVLYYMVLIQKIKVQRFVVSYNFIGINGFVDVLVTDTSRGGQARHLPLLLPRFLGKIRTEERRVSSKYQRLRLI